MKRLIIKAGIIYILLVHLFIKYLVFILHLILIVDYYLNKIVNYYLNKLIFKIFKN